MPVTARVPNEGLMQDLLARESEWADADIASVKSLGDCYVPGLIAAAVHAGHAYGRGLGVMDAPLVKREDHPMGGG